MGVGLVLLEVLDTARETVPVNVAHPKALSRLEGQRGTRSHCETLSLWTCHALNLNKTCHPALNLPLAGINVFLPIKKSLILLLCVHSLVIKNVPADMSEQAIPEPPSLQGPYCGA